MFCRHRQYETKRKCRRIRGSAADCGKASCRRQGYLRGSQARRGFSFFGTPMERNVGKRWTGGLKAKAASGPSMPSVEPTEKTVTENPSKRATGSRFFHRPVDLPSSGRGNPAELWGKVSSRSCLAPSAFAGLELPKTRTQGPRTRRESHPTLATAGLAPYKKKRIGRDIVSFFRMKAALCCSRCVAGHGRLKAKRLSNTVGTATTASRSSLLSLFPQKGGVWDCTFISIPKISALNRRCRSLRLSAGTWAESLLWFWTVTAFIVKQFVCLGESIPIGLRPNGFRRMLLILILWRGFGTIANIQTWPTLFQPTCSISAENCGVRLMPKNINQSLFCLTSNMQNLNCE